jgi:hypothetical protein
MFEIRNYHFEPSRFDEYKPWAESLAVPFLKTKMEIVGFWVTNDIDPIYGGSLPRDESVHPSNITWIIRWDDRAQRDAVWEENGADPAWQAILDQVPGGRESYLRTEVKFATEI